MNISSATVQADTPLPKHRQTFLVTFGPEVFTVLYCIHYRGQMFQEMGYAI